MLEVWEVLNDIKNRFYDLEDSTASWDYAAREIISRQWIQMLRKMTGLIRLQGAEQALQELAEDGHNVALLQPPAGWKHDGDGDVYCRGFRSEDEV